MSVYGVGSRCRGHQRDATCAEERDDNVHRSCAVPVHRSIVPGTYPHLVRAMRTCWPLGRCALVLGLLDLALARELESNRLGSLVLGRQTCDLEPAQARVGVDWVVREPRLDRALCASVLGSGLADELVVVRRTADVLAPAGSERGRGPRPPRSSLSWAPSRRGRCLSGWRRACAGGGSTPALGLQRS